MQVRFLQKRKKKTCHSYSTTTITANTEYSSIPGRALMRKILVNTCADHSNQLLLPQLPSPYQDLSVYEFLQNKTYKEEGCLINPTMEMANFVDRLGTLFCASFKGIMYMPGVLARLCKSIKELCTFTECKEVQCFLRSKSLVKLYMKVCIFHALKRSNVQNNEGKTGKHNRKMLKCSHLYVK